MDSVSVAAFGRHNNEPSKRQKCREGEDMISNLPDFIIGRILSFLPTKEAVRTSVLSKRWIFLWTFIIELSFDDMRHLSSKSLLSFVNRVLLHLNSSSIESFSLTIAREYDPSHIGQWISAVLNRRVKKLRVNSHQELDLASHTILKSQSLEELVLHMYGGCGIRVPTFACLSSLTVLELTGITFTCYSSNDSKKVTLNFPVLKWYESEDCHWVGVKSVTLEVPLLEVLSIKYSPPCDVSNAEIKFCASRLTKFRYSGFILSETILLATQIGSASIALSDDEYFEEAGVPVLKLLSENVECLKLKLLGAEEEEQEILERANEFLADIPAFGMLTRLKLECISGEVLLCLLSKSPCLETLVLKELLDFDEELLNSANEIDCCPSTLKVVKFERIVRYDHELRFAKFVKRNAKVLERISFSRGIDLLSLNSKEVQRMLKKSFNIVDFSSDSELEPPFVFS